MEPQVSIEETQENERSIRIAIPHQVFRERYDQILRQTTSRARIKGFRPGHVPPDVVAKLYGDSIREDAIGALLGEAYRDAIKGHSLRVVGNPQVHLEPMEENKDVMATARVDIFPEPVISDYFGVSFDVELDEYSEEQFERALQSVRNRFATTAPVEGRHEAAFGDVVIIDYTSTVDGKPFEGSNGVDAQVEVGAGQLPEDFEKSLIGMRLDEEKMFSVTFPADLTNQTIAGKVAEYQVKLKSLQQKVLPELTDAFVKENLHRETLADFKEHLHDTIEKDIAKKNKNARETGLFTVLAEKNVFRVPQTMIDEEIRAIFFEMGLLNAHEEKSFQADMSRFREKLGATAETRVRRQIILEQIIRQEKLEISDAELEAWLDNQVEQTKQERKQLEKYFGLPKNTDSLKQLIAKDKMTVWLLERATIKEKREEQQKE